VQTLRLLIVADISKVIELADAYNIEKCELLVYLGQDDSLLITGMFKIWRILFQEISLIQVFRPENPSLLSIVKNKI
jgi:hypothetical protein